MTEPGQRLGDYEIVRELGHGGMGQVYLVRNIISDRIEAMKVLLPDLVQQGDLANRFMREIKLLASLDHPNIAALRTAFTADNQLVMIMEYVQGDTLAHRLELGAFSTADTLNYISQVLSALSYAHGKGIIHRDIKPANMMLTPQGVVKLMDFGIARSTTDLGMTVTGTTMGSLDYMSPEQVKSEPTDARSDIYSVGVSMYEMVTGHRMFGATSSYSVMEAHVKEVPKAPMEVQPSVPKGLSDIIMMAVAKDPAQRFQTAEAFRNALSQVSASGSGCRGRGCDSSTPGRHCSNSGNAYAGCHSCGDTNASAGSRLYSDAGSSTSRATCRMDCRGCDRRAGRAIRRNASLSLAQTECRGGVIDADLHDLHTYSDAPCGDHTSGDAAEYCA